MLFACHVSLSRCSALYVTIGRLSPLSVSNLALSVAPKNIHRDSCGTANKIALHRHKCFVSLCLLDPDVGVKVCEILGSSIGCD